MASEPTAPNVVFDGTIITPEPVVDGMQLLNDLVAYFRRYVRVGEDEYAVLATWVLHCHAFKAFSRTPYLAVKSPTLECGKTQLLEVAKLVLPGTAQMASSTTAAVLARYIDKYHAPLLLDEVDKLKAGDKDLYAAVMGIVNGGYKSSGHRMLLVPAKGGDWDVKILSTFSPKILAGISGLEPATASRCVPINMERLLPTDSVHDIDEYITEPEAENLQRRARIWAQQNLEALRKARPQGPLRSRQREVSRPLWAIADLATPEWGERIRAALVQLFSTQATEPSDDIKVELLTDIKQAFDEQDRMASADLVGALVAMQDRPWCSWSKSKAMNQNQLARQLRDFKVYPKNMKLDGKVLKGYLREQFEPVWQRYLPHPDTQTATPLPPALLQAETQISSRYQDSPVAVEKCKKAAPILKSSGVAVQKPGGMGTAEDHGFDVGAMAIVEARLRAGKSVAPDLLKEYQERWLPWLDNRGKAAN